MKQKDKKVKNSGSLGSSFQSKEKMSSHDVAEGIEESEEQEKQSVEEQPREDISEDFKNIPGSDLEELDEEESPVETAEEVSKEMTVAFEKDSAEEMDELGEEMQVEYIVGGGYEEDGMEEFEEEESVVEFAPSETTPYRKRRKSEIFNLEEEEEEGQEEREDEEIEKEDEEALEEHLEDFLEELMEEEGEEEKAEDMVEEEDEEETEETEESVVEQKSTELQKEEGEIKSSIYFFSETSKVSVEEPTFIESKEEFVAEVREVGLEEEQEEGSRFSYEMDEDAWLRGLDPMDLVEPMGALEAETDFSEKSRIDIFKSFMADVEEVDEDRIVSTSTKDDELSSKVSESIRQASILEEEDKATKVPRVLLPERALLEEEYKEAWYELNVAKDQNSRFQDQIVQMLCKSEKDYNEYTIDSGTLQERELYVKLFSSYVSLMKHWGEMEDLEKEELIKYGNLRKEVEELFDTYIDKKWYTLAGRNRNEKSSKVQLANKLEETERKKWAEANELQVANLAIKMQMEKLSQLLKQREVIGGNFTIMGYNQLKHDNLMAREVIAQKNEQCESVLRNTKISAQKMTHIKEKLNFVRQQYKTKVDNLYAKERLCDQIYSELKEAKRARTKARQLLSNLQSKNDLLSYPELLMDYESGIEKTHRLKQQLGKLSYEYNNTTDHLKMLTKKLQSSDH